MLTRSRSLKAIAIVLTLLVIYCGMRIRQVYIAIHEIASHGGAVSDEFGLQYLGGGPHRVTFRLPGIRRPVQDSDSKLLAKALSAFKGVHTLDLMETNVSDDFIRNIARKGLARKINISDTQCTEESVRILAETQSCEIVYVHCLDISRDTLSVANSNDVEIVPLEVYWITGTRDKSDRPASSDCE